jgi:hypothetical protein
MNGQSDLGEFGCGVFDLAGHGHRAGDYRGWSAMQNEVTRLRPPG